MCYMEGCYVYGDDIYVDEYYSDEVWAHIEGFSDYMISNKGRVWSIKNRQFLKLKPMDRHGHLGVALCQNGIHHYFYIHRLVAKAFIPNPKQYPIVRHLYDIPEYNEVDDLAWGTVHDNVQDCRKNGRAYTPTDADRRKGCIPRMVQVLAIDMDSGKSMTFESQQEASRVLGVPQANIWKVLNGERCSAGGYIFRRCDNV